MAAGIEKFRLGRAPLLSRSHLGQRSSPPRRIIVALPTFFVNHDAFTRDRYFCFELEKVRPPSVNRLPISRRWINDFCRRQKLPQRSSAIFPCFSFPRTSRTSNLDCNLLLVKSTPVWDEIAQIPSPMHLSKSVSRRGKWNIGLKSSTLCQSAL